MNLLISHKRLALAVACSAALAGCDSITTQNDSPTIPRPTGTVVLGGKVTGLSTTRPVVLAVTTTNNGINDGTQEFSVRGTEMLRLGSVAAGANYNVAIVREPEGRDCTIANGSGTAAGDISNITVTCVRDATPLFTLTAAIAPALYNAPPEGFAVTLTTEEGSETIYPEPGQSSVTFELPIFYPAATSPPPFAYAVTATNTVGGITNRCQVTGGTGNLVATPEVTPKDITTGITVASCLYTISAVAQYSTPAGGVASTIGEGGLRLGLRNQITNTIVAEAPLITAYSATPVAFPGTFAANANALYEVVVTQHPAGQFCILQNGGLAQLVTANASITAQVQCRDVPASAAALKGTYHLDPPTILETSTADAAAGSVIPEPRVPTRNFMTFFENGTFLYGTHHSTATAGVEHGFYNYDPVAGTLAFTVWTDTNGVGAPVSFNATFTQGSPAVNSGQGLSGRAGYVATARFTGLAFALATPGYVTATNVVRTPGAPGTPGTLSMQFGTYSFVAPVPPSTTAGGNLNPVWTMTEPVSNHPIEGAWVSEDSKRFFVYDATTLYGFHAGVNGAPNLQDACYAILDWRLAESFYTRRGGDANCMTAANAELGLTAVGTVDVPNATTTNTTAPLIPGFIGRLPGSRSNLVGRPSPVRYKVEAGSPDTLTLQNTLNDNPIEFPVVLKRHTTY